MKKLCFILMIVLMPAASLWVSAQTPAALPMPTPTPRDESEVVKISTTLIQLDVTVVDRRGNPVMGLTADDFEIFENGERQKITDLTFISSVRARNVERTPPIAAEAPTPVPTVRPEQIRRTIALVIDDLTLSFQSVYQTKRALRKFVDEQMQEGDLVAIIRTGAGIGALQQFTSDKRILHAAIDRVRWNPMGRGNIGAFATIEPTPLEIAAAAGDTSVSSGDIEAEREFLAGVEEFRDSAFVTGTLGALRFVVTGMGELPGRKSVILFSDGFPIQTEGDGGRIEDFMRRLIDAANRASVVFYTLDARGLQDTGPTAADRIFDTSPQGFGRIMADRSRLLFETQGGLRHLAVETGGTAYINRNDLEAGLRQVLDDQSYYLLGYEPDDSTFDPKTRRYNKIEVRVSRPGVTVRYRSGFFNVANEALAKISTEELTAEQHVQRALTSPFALNSIELNLVPLYGNDQSTGNYVRSLLHVNGRDLKFEDESDGKKKAEFAILAASFGDNGMVVDNIGRTFTLSVPEEVMKRIVDEGFVYHFTFPVKRPGAYQYRVAVRDQLAGTVGSASQFIEIPDLKRPAPAISGIVLESFSAADWKLLAGGSDPARFSSDPMRDTSLRRFKRGIVLRYGFEIYNARSSGGKPPEVSTQIRLFRDGKTILEGKEIVLDPNGQADPKRLRSSGGINLPADLPAGDYILQIIVIDRQAKEKRRVNSRFVQFELVD